MNRKFICAAVVAFVAFGVAIADEFQATITKVSEDGKVTFFKTKFNKEEKKIEKGDDMTLPTIKDVKVVKGKFDFKTKKSEAGEAIEGGLKNEMFTKIDLDKKPKFGFAGVSATIITDDDNKNIKEIRVTTFGGGVKKKKKDGGQ